MANIISDETIEYVGILANAPAVKDGSFKVPKTVE